MRWALPSFSPLSASSCCKRCGSIRNVPDRDEGCRNFRLKSYPLSGCSLDWHGELLQPVDKEIRVLEMKFNVAGEGDNFLHVALERNEEINCESGAMVMMEGNLDLTGEMKGGFFSAIGRKLTNGESFFTQSIKANRGKGEALLSPTLPGDIEVLECGGHRQYYLNDGAFLASAASVSVKMRMQSVGRALFGGTGGFFIGQTEGSGLLAVSGFGTTLTLDVDATRDNPTIIDNTHVVAWDAELNYDLALSTNKSSGLLGSMFNSTISGEGIVTKFSGRGKVIICSRNISSFVSWIGSQVAPRR